MKCNTKLTGIIIVISIAILLILSGKVIGEEEDTRNTGTRGVLTIVQTVCVDKYHSILPGENTTFIIDIELTNYHYNDPINLSLMVENVPSNWHAAFNNTNFTVTKNSRCNVTLNISPPADAYVGSEICITVAGSWSYRDSDGEEIEGKISKCQIITRIIAPDLWVHLYDSLEPDQNPKVGQKIDIIAKICNEGDVDAENVSVRFMVDGKQVGESRTIPLIEIENYVNESFSWVAEEGKHILSVEVDYNNTIDEYYEYQYYPSLTYDVDNPYEAFIPCICTSILIIGFLILLILYRKKKKKEDKQVTLGYFAK